ncbi:phenylacetate--CoA ligase family protein [Legionella cincinnatiensis]|uniref:Coenzyme F390 synthetase n=1 Tax=Legionella cincinnatiensis TaxID=28085 RepID=A0A378IM69_9GAMM|nr:phenylacetate--CoA ligase family protein [Legionella cincinnatiensis]KTC83964.1 coenzyme F390 synthetase [Legionella cincinnatiensis]STX36256.1 Coenzyme F390 synthetase [Legionella cincinnatiensis]
MSLFDFIRRLNRALILSPSSYKLQNTEQMTIQQTSDMLTKYQEYQDALFCSAQTLQQIRDEQLRKLLIHAKLNSPWYQKALAHIDVENFTEERLNEIPIMDKITFMKNWDAIVTDRKLSLALVEKHIAKMRRHNNLLYLHDRYHVLASGGSSGTRGVFIYDWEEWNKYYLYIIRHPLYNHDRTQILIDPTQKTTIAQVIVTNTVYAIYSLSLTYKFDNIKTHYFPITLPLNQIIAHLNTTQADILQGTPSTIHKLCLEALKEHLLIQPKVICVGGEPLYKPIRELIKKVWPNVFVFNTYGTSEGLFGMNCCADSEVMHLNDDACIVEPVDELNRPVHKEVVPYRLYFTNLYNYTLPIIRYEVSDQLLFLDKKCTCGIQHQLIAEPQGRPEFDFIYPGNIFVHHLIFVTPLLHEKNIREYQVIQTKNGVDIKILTTGYVNKIQLQNHICAQLSNLGIVKPQVKLIEVSEFEYLPSGKLRRFLKLNPS